MTDEKQELQKGHKQELTDAAEGTRPGTVFTPVVDIFETDEAITVLADMPGVRAEGLDIDLRENVLSLNGIAEEPEGEGETALLREYETGSFYRQFRLSNVIDQSKIDASMNHGVLRLVLPKAEASKPRKIEVKVG